jgi:NADH-quinone oxidoreductase subunit K
MNPVLPVEYGLVLAGLLFVIGLAGVLVRRDIIFILLSLEVMLNAGGLAFIVAGARWGRADGQVMFIFILAVAAAEVAVALALLLWFHYWHKNLNADSANEMWG